jgi:putative ABC transport system permease protein
LRESLEAIPGVQQVETRVVGLASTWTSRISPIPSPVCIISLPDGRNAALNSLYLREGRLPEPGSEREVVVNEAFADAHGFRPGDRLAAIINGRWQKLAISGIGLSPEYIYQIKPGDLFPDFERYGVLWMNRSQLAAAYDMDGAFNDVVLTLSRDARTGDVIDRLDAVLDPYGGRGAIGARTSSRTATWSVELDQLRTMATIFPAIFLGVAAFLLNVVLTRLIGNAARPDRDPQGLRLLELADRPALPAAGADDHRLGLAIGTAWRSAVVRARCSPRYTRCSSASPSSSTRHAPA